jgi:predicted RNase H-like HicB family nuclease
MKRLDKAVTLDNYKVVLYRNQPDGWVAEVPAISGCYALMPTREEALAEMSRVFEMIAAEYRECWDEWMARLLR